MTTDAALAPPPPSPADAPCPGSPELSAEVSRLLAATTDRLAASGVPDPRGDALALLLHAAGLEVPAEPAVAALPERLDPEQAALVAALADRRAARTPLEHLLGYAWFRGIRIEVGPGAFVPQPETGALIDQVRRWLSGQSLTDPLVVDLCTGAGTVALALAHEEPSAQVHAVELSPDAAAFTRRNAERRAAAGDRPVSVHLGRAADALPELDGQVDVVVSNPPYVADHEAHLPRPEVVDHDPAVALFAGSDGLAVVREVERAARRLLRPGGLLAIEHSDRQGRSAPALLRAAGGWVEVADHVDDDELDRVVTAVWAPGSVPGGLPGR